MAVLERHDGGDQRLVVRAHLEGARIAAGARHPLPERLAILGHRFMNGVGNQLLKAVRGGNRLRTGDIADIVFHDVMGSVLGCRHH